jgi:hypothetical protein
MKRTSKKLLQQRLVTAEVTLAHARQDAATAKVVEMNEQAEVDRLRDLINKTWRSDLCSSKD